MSFFKLRHRHSWPPASVAAEKPETLAERINENPFAFFISPPESDYDEDPFDFSAGIITGSSQGRSRSTSTPSKNVDDDHTNELTITKAGKVPSATLRRLKAAVEKHHPNLKLGLRGSQNRPALEDLAGVTAEQTVRGRKRNRLLAEPSRGRQTRSLSGGRAHVWREPSVDLWTVMEERESLEDTDGEASTKQMGEISAMKEVVTSMGRGKRARGTRSRL